MALTDPFTASRLGLEATRLLGLVAYADPELVREFSREELRREAVIVLLADPPAWLHDELHPEGEVQPQAA